MGNKSTKSRLERLHPRRRLSVSKVISALTPTTPDSSPVVPVSFFFVFVDFSYEYLSIIPQEDFAVSSSTYFCKERQCKLITRFDAREMDGRKKNRIIIMFDFIKSNSLRVEYVDFDRTKMFRFDELKRVDVNGSLSVRVSFKSPVTMRLMDMLEHRPEPSTTWSFDSHRHLFQFLKSVGSAFRKSQPLSLSHTHILTHHTHTDTSHIHRHRGKRNATLLCVAVSERCVHPRSHEMETS